MTLENWEKDAEDWADEIKDVIEAGMEVALLTIATAKADTLAYEVPRRYAFGSTTIQGEYPLLTVESIDEEEVEDAGFGQTIVYHFEIEIWEYGERDEESLTRRVIRYAKAARQILEDQYKDNKGTWRRTQYSPALDGILEHALLKACRLYFEIRAPRATGT